MKIFVDTSIDIDSKEIAKAMIEDPSELGSLFSCLANELAENKSSNQRRLVAGQISEGLSEHALKLLGEVVALGYHRAKSGE